MCELWGGARLLFAHDIQVIDSNWKGKQAEWADEVRVLSNWRIMIQRVRRPFLYKEGCLKPNHQHPIWILHLNLSDTPSPFPTILSSIQLSPLVLILNVYELSNIVQLSFLLIPLAQGEWLTLTPVLGWYPVPSPPVTHIQPIPQLEPTPV